MSETLTMQALPSENAKATFEALYRSSRDDVYAYVIGMVRDRAAAEDVTAQAFERAYRRRLQFDRRRGNQRAWIFGIARNAALDELRRRRRVTNLTVEPEDLASQGPEDHAELAIHRSTLLEAIAQLNPREREIVLLKFNAGLSNAELAGVLGVSTSNAGTMLHRTIEKLRKACHETA